MIIHKAILPVEDSKREIRWSHVPLCYKETRLMPLGATLGGNNLGNVESGGGRFREEPATQQEELLHIEDKREEALEGHR